MKKISLLAITLAVLLIGASCQKQKQDQVTSLPPAETQEAQEKQKESVPAQQPKTDSTESVSIDKNFRITNVGDSDNIGDSLNSIFPIHAYNCWNYQVKDGVPLSYSKIDFFISKNEKNAPTIFLGTTPPGGAGSGECNLYEDESSLKSKLEPGKYQMWAVRYIDNKPDKRTPDVFITLK